MTVFCQHFGRTQRGKDKRSAGFATWSLGGNLPSVRIPSRILQLRRQGSLESRAQEVLHSLRARVQMIKRQLGMLAEIRFPQPMPSHDLLGPLSPCGS